MLEVIIKIRDVGVHCDLQQRPKCFQFGLAVSIQ